MFFQVFPGRIKKKVIIIIIKVWTSDKYNNGTFPFYIRSLYTRKRFFFFLFCDDGGGGGGTIFFFPPSPPPPPHFFFRLNIINDRVGHVYIYTCDVWHLMRSEYELRRCISSVNM